MDDINWRKVIIALEQAAGETQDMANGATRKDQQASFDAAAAVLRALADALSHGTS